MWFTVFHFLTPFILVTNGDSFRLLLVNCAFFYSIQRQGIVDWWIT
jgi:hypothetical protein